MHIKTTRATQPGECKIMQEGGIITPWQAVKIH